MTRALVLLALAACNGEDDTGLADDAPIRSCEVTLSTEAPEGASTLEVAGRFNDWEPQAMELHDGVWTMDLGALRPGVYAYKFVVDGEWQAPPPDDYTTWEQGQENRALFVEDCEQPALRALDATAGPDGTLSATFEFVRAADGEPLQAATATVGATAGEVQITPSTGRIVVTATDLPAGKHSIRLTATDTDGRAQTAFVPLWVEDEPYSWRSGLLYYVFLDRFADAGGTFPPITGTEVAGINYLGGDLVGATERMEEGWFDALGVRSIWLSPVYQNPDAAFPGSGGYHYTGYHGYWPIDPRGVEDRLGTDDVPADEALHTFIETAHAHGIRVMLDLVLNHVHDEHPYVEQLNLGDAPCPCTSEAGPCNWDSNPLGCWFTDYLPDVDYRDHRAVTAMVDDITWWTETYDIDGYRIDAAKHMDHVIMRTLRMHLEDRYEVAGGAPFYLVGETFVGEDGQGPIMDYVADYELHGQFDFPLVNPLRRGVGQGQGFGALVDQVRKGQAAYGRFVHDMSPFMGNHDIERYATTIAGCPDWQLFGGCTDVLAAPGTPTDDQWALINKLSLSFAFVATQPGVPLLYYGDEVGLAGAGDPDNRRMMPWTRSASQDLLLERVRALGTLRTELPALQEGDLRELWVDDSLYVYARSTDEHVALVGLHIGATPRTTTIVVPTGLDLNGVTLTDALAGTRSATVQNGELSLTLDPWEYVVLVP